VSPSHINNNFSYSCDGKFIGYINKQGDIIISNTDTEWNDSYASYLIKSNYVSNEGFLTFVWDTVFPNKIFYSTNNSLYECMINENELMLYINKCYALSGYSKFINCFPSPKGDIIILLYEKGIQVYDMFQNLLFSKRFNTSKFINALYDYKSSVFITYEERKLMIFNVETFDYKEYSYFPGSIIKVINNPKNDNIYIFVIDKTKEASELFMITLSDISIASDVNLNNDSYHNCDNFYRHCHYVLRPEVYAFQYSLGNFGTKIIDVDVSPNDYRVGILIQENIPNQIQNSLYIFGLTKDKRDNIINKIEPLYNFGHIDGSQIVSFEFNKMIKQNTFLVVRFENDFFIKTKRING
jgi:CRISPR/Cas system-associated endoribonuclease Cas2